MVDSTNNVSALVFKDENLFFFLPKVNKPFEDLQLLQELNDAWREVGPRIKNYMESSVEIQLLQVSLTLLTFVKVPWGF